MFQQAQHAVPEKHQKVKHLHQETVFPTVLDTGKSCLVSFLASEC